MNNRLLKLFEHKKQNILNIYCTAGFPTLNDTSKILSILEQNGADIIEIGIPYSDPLADGPTIQESNKIALDNGMSIAILFEQLKNIRKDISLPLILMSYLNPILQYGYEEFCKKAGEIGIDGLIIPDLPIQEFKQNFQEKAFKNNLSCIFLITPSTSEDRIRLLDDLSSGFLYVVSSSGTTGKDTDFEKNINFFKSIQKMNLKNPLLVGFGIKNKQDFQFINQYANGSIIGSAYIKALMKEGSLQEKSALFLKSILE